ncbi:DNA repair protein RecO [Tistrella bauzanensis]
MIDWTEEGVVLAARRHGEADVLLSALTAGHGRHMGLVRGGAGRRLRGALEPGNRLRMTWKSRLDAQLGAFTIEPVDEVVGRLIDDADRLTALGAMAAVLDRVLPDRQTVPGLFERTQALILALEHAPLAVWGALFVMHERDLLAEMGFGLDLARCAVTGARMIWPMCRRGPAVRCRGGRSTLCRPAVAAAILPERHDLSA